MLRQQLLGLRQQLKKRWQQSIRLRQQPPKPCKATDAAKIISEVEGEGMIAIRMVQKWFKEFDEGDTNLQDELRSGRPTSIDSDAMLYSTQ